MADVIKIADLIAQFGLDAGPLIKGLEDVEVRLSTTGQRVVSLNALLKSLGEGANFGTKFQQQFDDIRAAAQLAQEQAVQMAAQERELQKMLVAEEKAALEEKKAARASYVAWWQRTMAEEELKDKEAKELETFNEKQALKEQQAERARYIAWWTRTIDEQVALHKAGQESMVAMTEDATAKQIISNFKVRTEAQAGLELLGVKGLGTMARLVAYSPVVASALESVFNVVMVAAFIDILVGVVDKFDQLIRNVEGFDKASIKAWEDARVGSEAATQSLLKYKAAQREVEAAGLKGAAKYGTEGQIAGASLADQRAHLSELQAQAKSIAQLLMDAKFSDPSLGFKKEDAFHIMGMEEGRRFRDAIQNITDQGDSVESLAARYKHLQDEIRTTATEIGKLGQTIEKDKLKEERAPVRGQHKLRGPEDHEEPYRLPWYMGPNAAESFAGQVHGQRMSGMPSATQGMFNRADNGGGAQPAMIQVATNINPQFVFHGVPADIQAFMRDHAEPQLAKDIELNTRGIGARVVKALKESGMAVSG